MNIPIQSFIISLNCTLYVNKQGYSFMVSSKSQNYSLHAVLKIFTNTNT